MNNTSKDLIRADFNKCVAVVTASESWVPSPQPGVDRIMLDRIGGEVARATSLVRYAPQSRFNAHRHDQGEEFLVLDGVFSDEYGDYPAGTYVRNPPGSGHAPRTQTGCVIFVKLRQMPEDETERVVIDTGRSPFNGRLELYSRVGGETVAMERLQQGESLAIGDGGAEILILDGGLEDDQGAYGRRDWLRIPAGAAAHFVSRSGALIWVKRGHLAAEKRDA